MLLVVLLMSIFAALIIPRFQPSHTEQLRSAAEIITADLGYARSLAVANGSTYQVHFDLAANSYTLTHTGASALLNTLPPSPFSAADDTAASHTTRIDDLPLFGSKPRLTGEVGVTVIDVEFNALGGTTSPTPTSIWLTIGSGSQSRRVRVDINPITGLPAIGEFTAPSAGMAPVAPLPATP